MRPLKKLSFVIVLLCTIVACDMEYNSNDANDPSNNSLTNTPISETPTEATPTQTGDLTVKDNASFTIVAGKRVGQITATTTEAELIQLYGESQVQRREIGMGEGETAPGTVVFPGTDNELIVEWENEKTYETISSIRIDGEQAQWTTEEGIRIGTTLDELRQINGKEFQFYGFEWDYAGTTNEWEGGRINKNLTVILTPNQPEAAFPDLLGDQLFPSDHPKAEAADLTVSSMTVKF